MKWANYCISKLSFVEGKKTISEAYVHEDKDETVGIGETRDRNWLVQKATAGYSFCCITKNDEGNWIKKCDFTYANGVFNWNADLPLVFTKRKSFLSYYHTDDQWDRDKFENRFGDLIVSKSVGIGDIADDNSQDYIKQLIQKQYLHDTTVLIVLIGKNTKCRKHVDWEISGALNYKIGDCYAGLLGLVLPDHTDFGTTQATYDLMPARLADNFKSGYAVIRDWTDDRKLLQSYIELAYANRSSQSNNRNNARAQMQRNTN